ncbi:hypothetical protein [Halodesulfovibrio marinisediminis]|uniref:hypothetical protein n=1 Tax=Halodesulfovibrio marinisediminis TaxID=458711 RepID=UPI00111506E9|nr:hypothetical protein [Halodesulfovibrio marinisediminis]
MLFIDTRYCTVICDNGDDTYGDENVDICGDENDDTCGDEDDGICDDEDGDTGGACDTCDDGGTHSYQCRWCSCAGNNIRWKLWSYIPPKRQQT